MRRGIVWGLAGIAAWMLACRFVPGLAALWQGAVSVPALGMLHRAAAALPFPVIEPLALAVPLMALGRRGPRRLAAALMVAAGMYALLWYPAYWARPAQVCPRSEAARVEALCADLIDALNAADPDFDGAAEAAGDVAGVPWARVKAARYPEWMAALGVSGLFSPWTGEVLVNPEASPACRPFTCVHELIHLRGVADEGAANIEAYRACLRRGGAFAYSARLWALRYALERLSATDPEACRRCLGRMQPPLARNFIPFDAAEPNPVARVLGIGAGTSDYGVMVDWLVGEGTGNRKCGCRAFSSNVLREFAAAAIPVPCSLFPVPYSLFPRFDVYYTTRGGGIAMNIAKYQAFIKVVETGSLTRAAEALGLTQSGVSHTISSLEEELGFTLLIRSRSGARLTAEGERVLPAMRSILNGFGQLEQIVSAIRGLDAGEIRVGTFTSVAVHWLPGIIKTFQQAHPRIDFKLLNGDYHDVERWLQDGSIDAGFVTLPARVECRAIPLREDRLLAILPLDHPKAKLDRFPLSEIPGEAFISLLRNSDQDARRAMELAGVKPDIKFTTKDDYAILAMVENGLGISIVPELLLQGHTDNLRAMELFPRARRTIALAVPEAAGLSPAVQAFVDHTRRWVDEHPA